MTIEFVRVGTYPDLLQCPKCFATIQRGFSKGHIAWHKGIDAEMKRLDTLVAALKAPGGKSGLSDLFGGIL